MSDRLAEIEARWKAATPGPWKVEVRGNTVKSHAIVAGDGWTNVCCGIRPATGNATAIAYAQDDVAYLLAEVRRLREQAEQEHAAATEALRLMGEHAREAGELRGERDWLRDELRRVKATPYVPEECDDLRAAWRSEDSPAYGAPIRLHFNTPPKELRYVKAVVTRVDRPGPRRMDDDEETAYAPDVETPQRERLHTLVYEPKGDDCE
jgi:hypothetical protein